MTLKSKSRLRAPQRAKRKVVINSNKVVINNFKLTRPNDVLVTLIYHKPQICWILLFLLILPVKSRGLKLCVFIFWIFSFLTFYFLFSSVLFTLLVSTFSDIYSNDVLVTLIYHKPQICWILLFLLILPVKSRGLKLCVFIFWIFSFLTFYFLFSSVLFTLLVSTFSDIYFKNYQLEGYGPGRFCFFQQREEDS